MFGCFSKKKKEKDDKPKIKFVEPSRQQQSLQANHPTVPFKPEESGQADKMTNIQPLKTYGEGIGPLKTANYTFKKMDQLLESQLGEISIGNAQQTAKNGIQKTRSNKYEDIVPVTQSTAETKQTKFKNTKSQYFSFHDDADYEESQTHFVPKPTLQEIHTFNQLTEKSLKACQTRKSTKKKSLFFEENQDDDNHQQPQFNGYDQNLEQWALQTKITLENFKLASRRIQMKIEEELEDDLMKETLEEAENSFYCSGGDLLEEFTRAIITCDSPQLSRRIFSKMSSSEKNSVNFKGYRPIQLVVLKALSTPAFQEFAKIAVYDEEVELDCRGPNGWTPLQEALFYRNIPLATHTFKAAYASKHRQFQTALSKFSSFLEGMDDFEMEIEVKVDSFLPLVGSLTPSDTLLIRKSGNRLRLNYSLVGYEFPSCKRRDMGILFDGRRLWGVNGSKGTYCDLLQPLEHDQMVLMVEDMLSGEMRRGWPIVHSLTLVKTLSLFQNEVCERIAGVPACKHTLQLCYSSTADKRRSQIAPATQVLGYLSSYAEFSEREEGVRVQEKNRNKRVELEVWMAGEFGLGVGELVAILEVLSMGNSLVGEWSRFFRNEVGRAIEQSEQFPVKIDIPLNYSLFFNIEFSKFAKTPPGTLLDLPLSCQQVPRKDFQGTLLSKQKRSLFIQAYT